MVCVPHPTPPPARPPLAWPTLQRNTASPQGGTLEIVRGAGGEYGVCHLADGVVMDEWALFYRDHPQKQ